jgi:hypothetical protein
MTAQMDAQRNGHAKRPGPDGPAVKTVCNGSAPPQAEPGGRAPDGRFAAGNRCAKGNPHHRRMAALRTAFLTAATEERLKALGEKLYAAAVGGDWAAAKLFLLFTLGKPPEPANPDTLDLEEFRLFAANPAKARVLVELLDGVDAGQAADMLAGKRAADRAAGGLDHVKLKPVGHSGRLIHEERVDKRKKQPPPAP